MVTFSDAIMALTGNVTARVLSTMGLGFISYEAISVTVGQIKTHVLAQYIALDSNIYAVLQLSGFGEALNIILSALVASAGLLAVRRLGSVA